MSMAISPLTFVHSGPTSQDEPAARARPFEGTLLASPPFLTQFWAECVTDRGRLEASRDSGRPTSPPWAKPLGWSSLKRYG